MAKKVEFNLDLVKKWSFWVLVPLVLLLAFIFNFLAVGTLGKKFTERKNALEATKSSVEKIHQDSIHPNNNTIDDVKVLTEDLRTRFVAAWTTLVTVQQSRNIWPENAGRTFIDEVSTLKFGNSISLASVEHYFNFMRGYIPKLEADVNRRRIQVNVGGEWKDKENDSFNSFESARMRTANRSGGIAVSSNLERETGIVEWANPEIRNIIMWVESPKPIEVWYAQEDIWVYEALIWVIKMSNTGASSPHSAVVKRIESMLIGQQAARELASQLSVQTIGTGAGDAGMSSRSLPPPPSSSPSMPLGSGLRETGAAMSEEDISKMKRHERYVDANNVPLAADAPPPFGEFNRMPICLKLVVDRQRIPDILVNCANCAMPIDVLSVRINPGSGSLAGSRDTPNRPVGGAPSGSNMGKQVTMDGTSGLDSIYGPNAVPIEIYGCINIFNPVDQNVAPKPNQPTE
ncbi:MAG: hypothetical protein LBJ00_10415 [Planctomycetaceae bacterium]|jgi:hypothetical protein|nr:hypothetical protein [Planctomycetaceae bacterium]